MRGKRHSWREPPLMRGTSQGGARVSASSPGFGAGLLGPEHAAVEEEELEEPKGAKGGEVHCVEDELGLGVAVGEADGAGRDPESEEGEPPEGQDLPRDVVRRALLPRPVPRQEIRRPGAHRDGEKVRRRKRPGEHPMRQTSRLCPHTTFNAETRRKRPPRADLCQRRTRKFLSQAIPFGRVAGTRDAILLTFRAPVTTSLPLSSPFGYDPHLSRRSR